MFIPGIMLKNIRNDKSSLFISEYIGLILACQKKCFKRTRYCHPGEIQPPSIRSRTGCGINSGGESRQLTPKSSLHSSSEIMFSTSLLALSKSSLAFLRA
jgi:hypothetical protein